MSSLALDRFNSLFKTKELPSLGPEARPDRIPLAQLNAELTAAFQELGVPRDLQQLLRALVLLYHDHLHESHTLSQEIHTMDGSYLHGMMHRRETDFWNAKYWFNRVGGHPAFGALPERVRDLLDGVGESELAAHLLPAGKWDPGAFVDACEGVAGGGNPARIATLKGVQAAEFQVLLNHFCARFS